MGLGYSSTPPLITVFGGSGFVGRHTVRNLAKAGWRVRVACRRPDLAFHLQPLGKVGQIQAVQANVRYPTSITSAVAGAEVVINLTGVLMPSGRQSFDAIHRFGAGAVARAARTAGVGHMIHVSGIGADTASDSLFARSKGVGELAVREAFPEATIVRPSLVFGPEDGFFNRFAAIARMSPVLPLFGGGQSKFQPVYVGDVAKALTQLSARNEAGGKVFELGGPEVKTFEELLQFICASTGRKRLLISVPAPIANIQAWCLELAHKLSLGIWPDWLTVTRDQIKLLQLDNVVSEAAASEGRGLRGLGIEPESIATIVPSYLYRFRKTGQFEVEKPA